MTDDQTSREDARAAFTESGLTYPDLTRARLAALRTCISDEMKLAGLMNGTLQMQIKIKTYRWPQPGGWAALLCRSYYFKNREAVTFNPNGFVGFCGWADDIHAHGYPTFRVGTHQNAPALKSRSKVDRLIP